MTRVFKKAAGLGRKNPPPGSTFTIPAREPGRYRRVLKFGVDSCLEVNGRELSLRGRPLKPGGGKSVPALVVFTDRPPKLIG
jgi:hypothetical protein